MAHFTMCVVALWVAAAACGGSGAPSAEDADGSSADAGSGQPDAGAAADGAADGDPADANACGGLTPCGERCVDLQSDPTSCGACGTACEATEACEAGVCVCAGERTRCGLDCVDTQSDPNHCGGCGVACGSAERCNAGTCALQCDEGLTACEGACVDIGTSLDHCGGCGQACVAGVDELSACVAGRCERTCDADAYDLDGAPGCEYRCAPAAPGPEVCDGEDNDCNGDIDAADAAFTPPPCEPNAGVCAGLSARCVDGALRGCDEEEFTAWAAEQGALYTPGEENACDGADNDCDGAVDEVCCTDDDLPFVVEALNDNTRDDWYTLRTWNLVDDEQEVAATVFLGSESRDDAPRLKFGLWELDTEVLARWPVDGETNDGVSIGVDHRLDGVWWWTATPSGIQVGTTTGDGAFVVPFTVDPDIAIPADGLSGVEAVATRDGYLLVALLSTDEGDRLALADFRDLRDVWRFGSTEVLDGIRQFAAWRTPTRRVVCALVTEGSADDVRCWVFDQELAELSAELVANAPSLAAFGPFVATGEGGAVLYTAAEDDACEGSALGLCNEPIVALRVSAEGALEARSTGRTSYGGYVQMHAAHGGAAWVYVVDRASLDDEVGQLALYRVADEEWTLAARWDFSGVFRNVPFGVGAGVVYDDAGLPWAVLRVPNLGADEPGLEVWPLSRQGPCLRP